MVFSPHLNSHNTVGTGGILYIFVHFQRHCLYEFNLNHCNSAACIWINFIAEIKAPNGIGFSLCGLVSYFCYTIAIKKDLFPN